VKKHIGRMKERLTNAWGEFLYHQLQLSRHAQDAREAARALNGKLVGGVFVHARFSATIVGPSRDGIAASASGPFAAAGRRRMG
jgi:hypothetical protein